MTPRFTQHFRTRYYELDALGRAGPVTLVQFMQEAAIEASTALGFSPAWYRANGTLWVVRRLWVRTFAPLGYGDEVEVATWISGMRGVRSNREYDLTRGRDGARVARGRAEWVYVDAATGQPILCPDEWVTAFPRAGRSQELDVRLPDALPTEGAHRFTSRRTVEFHELDAAGHVNHACYLRWTTQAYLDALRALGFPPERTREEGWQVVPTGHEVQYFASALDHEKIEVISRLGETGGSGWGWEHEVVNADTRQLLVRAFSAGLFATPTGEPIAPPGRVIDAVLRGPTA